MAELLNKSMHFKLYLEAFLSIIYTDLHSAVGECYRGTVCKSLDIIELHFKAMDVSLFTYDIKKRVYLPFMIVTPICRLQLL